MVASASSSKTQCPSGRWSASNASVAAATARSSAGGALFAILSVNWSDVSDIASLLSHFADQIGRPVTGPYRALDGRRQPRRRPIAGEQDVIRAGMGPRTFGVLARQCGERGPPLPHDLPRGQGACNARDRGDLPPDLGSEFHPRGIEQPIGAADGDGKTVVKGEQPLGRAVDDAGYWRARSRRFDAEMGVNDGAKLGRRRQAGNER